jgi:D-alanyl-D-alanine carboxypeptidase
VSRRWSASIVAAVLLILPAGAVDVAHAVDGERDPAAVFVPPSEPPDDEPPPTFPAAPAVSASSYLLVDATTGQVLASRRADRRVPVASTIKVLTALTVLTRTEPGERIEVGPEVQGLEGASVGLDPGEQWTVEQLLDGLIARSGNDAAVALAAHVGGGVGGFLELMRDDAAGLGIEDATIGSPSGLEDENRLSARDLALISRVAMTDGRFRALAQARSVDLPGIGPIASRNLLLDRYSGATGVKTGYTEASGYCLVASAERNGHELIAVLLGADEDLGRFDEAARLLDHGFETLRVTDVRPRVRLRRAGGWVTIEGPSTPVWTSREVSGPVVDVPLPIEPPRTDPSPATVREGDAVLATIALDTVATARPQLDGGAALSRVLVDRMHAAMRAATRADAWSG